MKNAKKTAAVLAVLSAVSVFSSCKKAENSPAEGSFLSSETSFFPVESSSSSSQTSKYPANSLPPEEIREFVFNSAEDVEALSGDDMVYLWQNYESVFKMSPNKRIEDEIDLFGVPLAEKTADGNIYREEVSFYVLDCKLPPEEINVNEPFPDEILREYIDEYCKDLISSKNNWLALTGTKTKDEEIICCGENDAYVEYSIRFTEEKTTFENAVLVTREYPRAYRRCFMKNELFVDLGDRSCPVYFGELSMDKVIHSGMWLDWVLYSEFNETEDAHIFTTYYLRGVSGDFGMSDILYLRKDDIYFDKTTHEMSNREGKIKDTYIPGTYKPWPEW